MTAPPDRHDPSSETPEPDPDAAQAPDHQPLDVCSPASEEQDLTEWLAGHTGRETVPTQNGDAPDTAQNDLTPAAAKAEVFKCASRWATLKRQADELTHARIEADEDLRLAACDDLDAANDDYEMGLHAVDEEEIPMGFVGEPCGSAKASAKDADRQFRMARLRYNRFRERSMRFDVWTERACREAHEAKQALLAAAEALPPAEDPPTDSTAGNGSQG